MIAMRKAGAFYSKKKSESQRSRSSNKSNSPEVEIGNVDDF